MKSRTCLHVTSSETCCVKRGALKLYAYNQMYFSPESVSISRLFLQFATFRNFLPLSDHRTMSPQSSTLCTSRSTLRSKRPWSDRKHFNMVSTQPNRSKPWILILWLWTVEVPTHLWWFITDEQPFSAHWTSSQEVSARLFLAQFNSVVLQSANPPFD